MKTLPSMLNLGLRRGGLEIRQFMRQLLRGGRGGSAGIHDDLARAQMWLQLPDRVLHHLGGGDAEQDHLGLGDLRQ